MNEENKELFKQALVEGLNRHFDKTIEEAKKIEEIEEIEEIARDFCGHAIGIICEIDGKVCDLKCSYKEMADTAYNAGYRKQSEGEWIVKALNNPMYESKKAPHCSNCGYMSFIRYDYCPNCGARMKGGE